LARFPRSRQFAELTVWPLSKLRERIQEELRLQLGRNERDFRLWQDKVAIALGELWEGRTKMAIAESVFFVPIITPTAANNGKLRRSARLQDEHTASRSSLLMVPIQAGALPNAS
jgi:hypothetical protein